MLFAAACDSPKDSGEARAWAIAFNGQEIADAHSAVITQGRALVLFAEVRPTSAAITDALLKGTVNVFEGRKASAGAKAAVHDSEEAYVKAILLRETRPEWFQIPAGQNIVAIYERRLSEGMLRYIVSDSGTVWIVGVGERWQ